MIRIIIYFMKLIVALLFAIFFSSCNFNIERPITGSGNVTTETRTVGEFKGISVSNALEVEVEQADSYEVTVEADDNLQQHIITKVENGILVIETEIDNFRNIEAKKIKVRMPIISSLEATSASSIKGINVIKSEKLLVDSSSSGEIDIEVEADDITCNSSSASSIEIKGKALKINTDASSSGEIDADELLANDVIASSSSAGSISVHPILTLKAEASSGGSVTYNSIPRNNLIKDSSSGGSISKTE
jgi:Putative auto-transporter adhesin, head GIN domain